MGDLLSKSSRSFESFRQTDKTIYHPFLGEFPIFQNSQTGESILQKKIDINQLGGNKSVLRTHLLLFHPSVIKFEGYERLAKENEYSIFFENFDCTLKQEIQSRASTNTRFTEKELIYLLRSISAALSYFQGNRIVHGQIRTETIVKSSSQYKILNLNIFGNYKSTYQQALEEMRKTQIRLLSPQLQEALFNKIVDPVHEGYKDDVYALGVVVLDAMTLSVDTGIPVSEKLARATQIYSKNLMSLVNKMLENIMSLRLDCIACNTIIENMYVQKDVIPHGLYSSRISQRDSFISYKNPDHERRMSTGVLMNDLKKFSPSYKNEKTLNEQHFSPSKQVKSRTVLSEGPFEDGYSSGHGNRKSSQADSILTKSYAVQHSDFQSPARPVSSFIGQSLSSSTYKGYPQSISKTSQPWEGYYNPVQSISPLPNYKAESEKKSYNLGTNTENPEVGGRNLSSLIKNDPLILSILAQKENTGYKPGGSDNIYSGQTYSSKVNYTPGTELNKNSGVYAPLDYRTSLPYTQTQSTNPSRDYSVPSIKLINSISYDLSPPQKKMFTQPNTGNTNLGYNKNEMSYKSPPTIQPMREFASGYSQPMQLDSSPIYAGYSQIEQNEKDINHDLRRSGIGSLPYSMNLNSSRFNYQ